MAVAEAKVQQSPNRPWFWMAGTPATVLVPEATARRE